MLELLAQFNQFQLEFFQTLELTFTLDQLAVLNVSCLTLFTLGLYVYRCAYKPHTRGDLTKAVQKNEDDNVNHYTQVVDRLENENENVNKRITALTVNNNKLLTEMRILEQGNAELKQKLTQASAITEGNYQRERLIVALAVDLEGFSQIEQQANRLLEALV